jgi:hypothetical protein
MSEGRKTLSASLASVDSPEGRIRVAQYLKGQPYPHYEPHPEHPDLLIRIDERGRGTAGCFINREFIKSDRDPSGDEQKS